MSIEYSPTFFVNQSIFFLLNCDGPEFTYSAACKSRTHGVDSWSIYTVFMVNATKKTVYTPWVNAMTGAFARIE